MPYMPIFGVTAQDKGQTVQPSVSHYQTWNGDFFVWEITLVATNDDTATANIAWAWSSGASNDSGVYSNAQPGSEKTLDTFFLAENASCTVNATAKATGKMASVNTQYVFNTGAY